MFDSLGEAIAALHELRDPTTLMRFGRAPEEDQVLAINSAAAAIPAIPKPGEHPDRRRDAYLTPDLELAYMHRQLIERGHAEQILAMDGGCLIKLIIHRIEIQGDESVYGFVRPVMVTDFNIDEPDDFTTLQGKTF